MLRSGRIRAALAGLVLSCGGRVETGEPKAFDPRCLPGAQLECACPGGARGTQVCLSSGRAVGVCECGSRVGSGGSTSTGTSGTGGGPATASQGGRATPSGGRAAGVPGR